MKSYKSESNVSPSEWVKNVDTVYHNYNIVEEERSSNMAEGEKTKIYTYDVDEYDYMEYTQFLEEKQSATDEAVQELILAQLGE